LEQFFSKWEYFVIVAVSRWFFWTEGLRTAFDLDLPIG